MISYYAPGIKTSSLYVRAKSPVLLKWNTQRRLIGTLPRHLSGTSPRRFTRMPWRSLKGTLWRSPISTSPRRLKQVSNETPNDFSVVRIHDVLLVRLYAISWNSQMKHPTTSLWYVSITSRSYVVAAPCLYYGRYYVLKLPCYDLHLVGFHVSFKYQIKHQVFLLPTRRETRELIWVIN